jgi:hypothetical protein
MVLEACWLHLCGVDSVESTMCYGELFVDLALVAAASVLFRTLLDHQSIQGFLEFSLLYFSIINGWYLYAHHFASRFPETSHIHWLLVCIFLFALCSGVNYASYADYAREFSLSMIALRMAALFMIARVGCHVTRAGPMCALLGFLTSDAILCFAIAASDETIAPFLWWFAATLEIPSDLLLTVGLSGSLFIPHNIKATMDRAWVLVLAPLGATAILFATNPKSMDDPLLLVASLVLQLLFGLLYYDLQASACSHVTSQSLVHQAILLILTKLLGWTLWTAGACLLVLLTSTSTDTPVSTAFIHVLLGWSVGGSLILFLGLRLFGGRPHDQSETFWAISCWTPFVVVSVVPPSRPLFAIVIYLILLSLLNILEAWPNLGLSSRQQQQQQQEDQNHHAGSEREQLLPQTNTATVTTGLSST